KTENIEVQLPAWRPGRYELGNFAKNIQRIEAFDREGVLLPIRKLSKDRWIIETKSPQSVQVTYNYYANELNAGSTYLDSKQLYVNGINCFLYPVNRIEEECTLSLDLPENYKVACGL